MQNLSHRALERAACSHSQQVISKALQDQTPQRPSRRPQPVHYRDMEEALQPCTVEALSTAQRRPDTQTRLRKLCNAEEAGPKLRSSQGRAPQFRSLSTCERAPVQWKAGIPRLPTGTSECQCSREHT